MSRFDHVVVGAGIVGSNTALQLAKTGKSVLLLDQFSMPHARGSSHGQSRMIRSCYAETCFAEMMPHAMKMWKELEDASGITLIARTGVLCIAESSDPTGELLRSRSNLRTYSPQRLEEMDPAQLSERYPLLKFDPPCIGFLDKSGGVLLANKALTAVQALYKKQGGVLWDECLVTDILPGKNVTLVTSRGHVTASSVVVCAGTWNRKLLSPHLIKDLPLQAAAVRVYYWREKEKGLFTSERGFPGFIDLSTQPTYIYGLPSTEYPGLVKVCIHGGVPCDPDARERAVHDPKLEKTIRDYVKTHLPDLEPDPAIVEICMYTLTPDELFILDVLPEHPNIVIGAGFSGTGFKTSPIVGKLLCQLATGVDPSLDLSPYSLSRFNNK